MPLGDPVQSRVLPRTPRTVAPVQIVNPWTEIINAGSLETSMGTPIINPDTQIFGGTHSLLHHLFQVNQYGTTLRMRLKYDRAATAVTTDLIVQVFARVGGFGDQWQRLVNKDGAYTTALTIALATDVDDGSVFQTTDPHPTEAAWDLDGCSEVLVGVNTILNTDGDDSLAVVEAKVI